jgi:L-threonylcarbamoyladenylate synthase
MEVEIKKSLEILFKKRILLYPTDTVWGIGCDATNEATVSKIFEIKKRNESKSLVVLVDSYPMLEKYIDKIPDVVKKILSKSKKPTTIIYSNPKHLAKNTIAQDNTIAIRIVQDEFCKKLINQFGKPIVSTSANSSGDSTPKSFVEISKSILDSVDYIVNLHKKKITNKSSSIIRILNDDSIEVIRV